jgi:hypothetical protein
VARLFPAVLATANVIEEGGEAAMVIAEALVGVPLTGGGATEPGSRPPVQEFILGAIEDRPGSAHGRLLLGRAAPLSGAVAPWARPLGLAVVAAPGLDLVYAELGSRYLATWDALSPEDRGEGEAALRRAFSSPGFLRAGLPTAVETLGPEAAIRALPDDPDTLRLAAQILEGAGGGRATNLVAARLKEVASAGASRPAP